MPVAWPERVVDRPNVLVRLVVLLSAAAGYLTLFRSGDGSPLLDWGFALAAVAIGLAGGALPLATSLGQTGLLLVADLFGTYEHGPAAFVKFVAVWSLFELAVRRGWRNVVAGMAALAAVFTLHVADDFLAQVPSLLFRLAVTVVSPALVGAYLRATRLLAQQARARVEEERARREMQVRAAGIAERAAIARELHDLVAHHVSSMVLRVGVARHVLPESDPRLTEVLDDLHATGSAALADLRRLVAVLRDPAQASRGVDVCLLDPDGLPASLRTVVENARRIGVTVDESVDPAVRGLDPIRARAVLRLAQEGLANVAKHAGPSVRAEFAVSVAGDGAVHLRICDDGGEATDRRREPDAPEPGFGLIGMGERVRQLGGSFEAAPADGGWRLLATLPRGGESENGENT